MSFTQKEVIMGDLENLAALKKMLERKDEEEAKSKALKEQQFIADATKAYLGKNTPVSGIQAYTPEEMIAFLNLPVAEVQRRMGGTWSEMDTGEFDTFCYHIKQKIQKSAMLLDWKS